MDDFKPRDLKTILHSKRANIFYLEYCRVLVKGGRVEFVTDEGKRQLYWNIPIANTTTLLLGTGTSITQMAMRELAKAGVPVGFCGSNGTPLFSGTEYDIDIAWFCPQSEYRPTEYLQSWMSWWFDDALRLKAAKKIQIIRTNYLEQQWLKDDSLKVLGFHVDSVLLKNMLERLRNEIEKAINTQELLLAEARLTKELFKMAAQITRYGEFTRAKNGTSTDTANRFLDHGNYLAYGLGATATWVLGLPHALSVLHGKTRRGGLVFDAADLIKDATILPRAFIAAMQGMSDKDFREFCTNAFAHNESLDFIFDTLKNIALETREES